MKRCFIGIFFGTETKNCSKFVIRPRPLMYKFFPYRKLSETLKGPPLRIFPLKRKNFDIFLEILPTMVYRMFRFPQMVNARNFQKQPELLYEVFRYQKNVPSTNFFGTVGQKNFLRKF